MKNALVSAALIGTCSFAMAKLPPPDEATKAKAAEAAARSAWQAKVDSFQLCKSQEKVVAHYRKTAAAMPAAGTAAGTAPASIGAGAVVPGATRPAGALAGSAPLATAAPTGAATPAASQPAAAGQPTPAAAASSAAGGSVAGAAAVAPCADPGPFAYTPPEQKPIEVSGAHSPAGTAASPPSTNTPAAAIAPAKK